MDRLTSKRPWEEALKDLPHELGYSHIWKRLREIEDILGSKYDLDRLRELVKADKEHRLLISVSAFDPVGPAGTPGYICADEDPTEIYRGALAVWGPDAQTLMAFEEMAELQKELCKHARGKHNRSAVAEEIADVQIMLEQMAELHGCAAQVTAWREVKLERLLERIKAAEAGKEGKYAGATDERGDRGVRDPLPEGYGGSVRGPAGEIGGEPPGPPEGESGAGT